MHYMRALTKPLPLMVIVLCLTSFRLATNPSEVPGLDSRTSAIGSRSDPATLERLSESYAKLPLSFEANEGQVDEAVKFLSRGNGYTLFLTACEAVLSLAPKAKTGTDPSVRGQHNGSAPRAAWASGKTVRMKLIGANRSPQVTGSDPLPGKSSYFIGNDPAKWRRDVSNYTKVKYQDVYPGIDLVYYGNQLHLENDWIIAPGADPRAIRFSVESTGRVEIDSQGSLVLDGTGEVRLQKPVIYQQHDGVSTQIAGGYVIGEDNHVGFDVRQYDGSLPLVIDPVLSYSTYLGGDGSEAGIKIAVDPSGIASIVGTTNSLNFPTSPGSPQPSRGSGTDVFVAKLNAAGDALLFSTYLGGTGMDEGYDIRVDTLGNCYVTGKTNAADFPTTPGAFRTSYSGTALDVFVAKIASTGTSLVFSTYIGSGGYSGSSLAVDSGGNSYLTGSTYSGSYPTTSGAFQTIIKGSNDIFVTKLNSSGTGLIYSTFLGGSDNDQASRITVDDLGNVYLTGSTHSADFPTTRGSFQAAKGAGTTEDVFITKLNPDGSGLLYSSYLGGSGAEGGFDVAIDSLGNAYVTGITYSQDFPITPGAFKTTLTASTPDVFVTKLNANGRQLQYSTFMGGGNGTIASSIAVDSAGCAHIAGSTSSPQYPVTPDALQKSIMGPSDVFVTKLNVEGSALSYSTFLGGGQDEWCNGIFVDSAGSIYLTGSTYSADFPLAGALRASLAGSDDAFVSKIAILRSRLQLVLSDGGVGTASTAGAGGSVQAGYASVSVQSGTTPYGTAVFGFRQNGVTASETGVPASPPTTVARIFIDFRSAALAVPSRSAAGAVDINTGVAVVNCGNAMANITYLLRNLQGVTLATGHGTLPAGAHFAKFIDQLKLIAPDFILPSDFQSAVQFGSLEISSNQPLSILALRMTTNQRKEVLFTTTPIADLTQSLAASPIYFSQFADGGGYTTAMVLLNTSDGVETGTFEILDDFGLPFVVNQAGGTPDYHFRFSIPAGGAVRFQTDGSPTATNVGWVRLIPDPGSSAPVGAGIFNYNPASVLLTESGIPSAASTTHARIYVDLSAGHNSGLAIANLTETHASISIKAFQSNGTSTIGTSQGPLRLPPGGHIAKFADQFVTGLPAGFTGILDISSATPFAALTLRSLLNERGDFLLTSFPIADADRTAPAPIVFPQIADGGGYLTQFILLSSSGASTATLSFYADNGAPLAVGK